MRVVSVPDNDAGLSTEAYERVRDAYWVLAFRGRDAGASDWLFGVDGPPPPVSNPSMEWRRPTYEEALVRQQRLTDPDFHVKEEWSRDMRWRGWYGVWRDRLWQRSNEYGAREYLRTHGHSTADRSRVSPLVVGLMVLPFLLAAFALGVTA